MADPSQLQDELTNQTQVGTNAQTRAALLKRNPHLRDGNASSPGFGGLGTRQFLQKQLMTPGSATSASSFEEGASYDGFSDEGTPGTDDGQTRAVTQQRVFVRTEGAEGATQHVTRTVGKQPTKRLSSPSRESLARRIMGTSIETHGMVDSQQVTRSAEEEENSDLPPGDMLTNLVVKRVPSLNVAAIQSTTTSQSVPQSPLQSTKVTRRIVASPRKTLRRRVVRKTGADGKVHEVVQYVDGSGKVVNNEGGEFFDGQSSEASSTQTTTTRRLSSQGQLIQRVVVRKTGADGQVREEVQYVDDAGNVVEDGEAKFSESAITNTSVVSTPTRTTTTRRIVTPGKLTRRILRRTGADGQVHELIQYLDADGNVVETEGDAAAYESAAATSVTRRVVTPSKTIRRMIVRRTGADGQVHEEVQFMDADGKVVQSDGSELVRTSSFTSSGRGEAATSSGTTTVTRRVVTPGKTLRRVVVRRIGADGQAREEVQYVDAEGNVVSSEGGDVSSSGSFRREETFTEDSDVPGRRKVTRRIIRRILVRKDGTRVAVEQYVDADGNVIEGEERTLTSAGSFTGSVKSDTSTGSRRTVTRRVVHNASSSSGAESEDEVINSDAEDFTASGSFRRSSVTTVSTPGRRVITRKVVTPQRVIHRMVTHKTTSNQGDSDVDDLDIDAEFVHSEGGMSSDESVGGSSRGGTVVKVHGVVPRKDSRRVVSSSTVSTSSVSQRVDTNLPTDDAATIETTESSTKLNRTTTPTRVDMTVVTEPKEGSTTPEESQTSGFKPGVIWDYFTKSEDEASRPEENQESVSPAGDEENKAPIPAGGDDSVEETVKTVELSNQATSDAPVPSINKEVEAAPTVAVTVTSEQSVDKDGEVDLPEEGTLSFASVAEPATTVKTTTTSEGVAGESHAAPGFWGFFSKSEDKPRSGDVADDVHASTENASKEDTEIDDEPVESVVLSEQQQPPSESGDVESPEGLNVVSDVPEADEEKVDAPTTDGTVSTESEPVPEVSQPIDTHQIAAVAGLAAVSAAVPTLTLTSSEFPESAADAPEVRNVSVESPVPSSPVVQTSATKTVHEEKEPRDRGGSGFWDFFRKSDANDAPANEPATTAEEPTETTAVPQPEGIVAASPVVIPTPLVNEAVQERPSEASSVDTTESAAQPTEQQPTGFEEGETHQPQEYMSELVGRRVPGDSSTFDVTENVATTPEVQPEVQSPEELVPAKPAMVAGAAMATAVAVSSLAQDDTKPAESFVVPSEIVAAAPEEKPEVVTSTTTGTNEENVEHPRLRRSSGGGFWGFFGRSEEEPKDKDVEPDSAQQSAASVAAVSPDSADQTVDDSSVKAEEVKPSPTSHITHVQTRKFIQEADQQQPGDKDGSIEDSEGGADVFISEAAEEEPTFGSAVEVSGVEAEITSADIPEDEEAAPSPKRSVLPTVVATTAGIATVAALESSEPSSKPEQQEPSDDSDEDSVYNTGLAPVDVDRKPAAETVTTTTTEVVEEESRGFWGFFGGKSETKDEHSAPIEVQPEPQLGDETIAPLPMSPIDVLSDDEDTAATPTSPVRVIQTSLDVNEEQQEIPVSRTAEMETPEGAISFVNTSSNESVEGKPPAPIEEIRASIVDVPEPDDTTPRDKDASPVAPAVAVAAAGVAGVVAARSIQSNIPDASNAAQHLSPRSGDVSVTMSAFKHPVVDTKASASPDEQQESPDEPRRKAGRSIWTFWGGREKDKPKSPLSEDGDPTDRDQEAVAPAAPIGLTEEAKNISGHTPPPSADEARAFWKKQDQENPTQVSYAAAVGSKYGPESKFEPVPADDKIRSPMAQHQRAVDSPRSEETAAAPAGTIVTEVTQTTVVVEEEEEAFAVGTAAPSLDDVVSPATGAATAADIDAVAHAQQPIERESLERNTGNSDKSQGGFWKFLGIKGKADVDKAKGDASPVAAVVTTTAMQVDEEVQPSIETKDTKVAATLVTPEVEHVRRSIPSDTPEQAAGSTTVAGKHIRDSDRRTTLLIDGAEPDVELGSDDHYVEVKSPRHGGHIDHDGQWTVQPRSIEWSKLRLTSRNWKNVPADTVLSGQNELLLDEVSGSVKPGEFLVITGPSKNESLALLSCLAGYEDAMEGNVTVNGRKWNEKMDRYIAYIMREDLFFETLTVYEHLVSQANLRMRHTHSPEKCLERVEQVIEDMGLSDCRDKLIGGGVSLRGITRGERKLLAFATALLTNPSILLAEEPTDGLDTFSAEKVVAKLRWLAFEKGMTVAVTLHHPSSHFYGLFDVLYLVTDGSCVYDGKAADCVAYFATIGYQCPQYMSPMDYFLLQMVVGDRVADDEGVARVETLKREWIQRNAAVLAENEARAAAASEDAVVDDYDQKNRYYHMGCCGQLGLLFARHTRRLSRYGFVFWWHLLAALLIGVVFGLVYLQLDLNDQKGIQNFTGAFFYAVVVQMLFIAYRTFVFLPRETAVALRERKEYRGGWYHLLCWYLTKIVAELPALILLSIVFFVPVFLLVGIGHGFKVYVYMQIVLVLAAWAAISLAFLALSVLRKVTPALIVYSVLLVLFVVFGGLLINVSDIPDWLVWLHYISPVKYAYEALMKIFWKRVDSIDCDWTDENCLAFTGRGVLKYYSMENRSALGDSLILLGICLVMLFVAFWLLLVIANKRVNGFQWRYDWTFKGALGSRRQRSGTAGFSQKGNGIRSSMNRVIGRKSHHSSSALERNLADESTLNHYIRVETPRAGSRGVCDAPSLTLGWSNLWLKTFTDKTNVGGETQRWQYLLSDASGSAKCGELVLITGPSNDANVVLLESLGGLQKSLKGKVTMNGVPAATQKIVDSSAYVHRDDLMYETLTVEEHLQFQAQLCVGKSAGGCGLCCSGSAGELEAERVEMVLDELELTGKRHMLIRYLSPADTKLLAVATALLSNPSILLVEEPTHGMDFYSSQCVVLKLRQLARGGRTVVVSMTHPSSHLYALFDVLYLLAGGAAVYHGKVVEAVPYFASLGYQCPQYMSPIDYFVRQVSTRTDSDDGQVTLFKEAWSTRYSELCLTDADDQGVQGAVAMHRRRVGCCGQLSLLFSRHVLRLRRYYVAFGWHAFWMVVLGVIFGLIFLQLDLNDQQDIQNWAGAFFYLVVLQMLVIGYRTFVFLPREMAIAEREHRGGRYYLACWYLTKVFAELPALMILSVLLFVPAYLLIGIGHGFKVYFYMQLVMWLAGWSAAGLATLLLGLFRHVRVALIVYALLLVLFVVFGGLLINVDDVPDFLIWLHYISPVKYGYEALMKLFWGRIIFLACGESDGSGSGSSSFATVGDDASFSMSGSGSMSDDCIAHSGHEVLTHYSMETSRNARSDTIILLELTVLYFFIGYAFLSLRWRRYKTRQSQHRNNSVN